MGVVAGLSTGGVSFPLPSWLVGFAIVVFIIGGVVTIWRVLWPLLKVCTALLEQLPYFMKAEEKHLDHEHRIKTLETAAHNH